MNMNNNEKLPFLKGKGASVALVLCFVAVIAMVGAFTYNNYRGTMEQQLAEAEDLQKKKAKQRPLMISYFQKQSVIHPIRKKKRMKKKNPTIRKNQRKANRMKFPQPAIPQRSGLAKKAFWTGPQAARY